MGLTLLGNIADRADADAGPRLSGDWGGVRKHLQDEGVDFQVGYTSETAHNAEGGTSQGTRYADQWTFGSTLDLARLWDVHDATLRTAMVAT